ncbi:MAG: IMPACT family protein [Ignavibacterium sp.]|uniref:IMPACT family protein n=1 Tax=Ignavibacterium sp. TaxID=2651167 RepID=UPI0040495A6D
MYLTTFSSKSLPKQFKTVLEFNESVYKEKSSEFIAQIYNVKTFEQANEILEKVREKYFDATHHCYAIKLINGDVKSSDDGEPKGTAGLRILNAIEHYNLMNVMIIVIRYFGGIKLGVGPLGKAYYQSAFGVIEKSKVVEMILYQLISVQLEFNYLNQFHRIVNNFEVIIDKQEYTEFAKFSLLIKPDFVGRFADELNNATNGKALYQILNSYSYV